MAYTLQPFACFAGHFNPESGIDAYLQEDAVAVAQEDLYLTRKTLIKWLGPGAVVGFALSVWFILQGQSMAGERYKVLCQAIGAIWVLAPPLWFNYEYVHYFPKHGNPKAGFTPLKASQDIAAKVWASFLVVLAALFTGVFPK